MTEAGDLAGRAVTVMGLGLFGGGAGAVRWLVRQGARVTISDLRTADELAPTLDELADLEFRTALGAHHAADFADAELVVANPAVPPTSPWLREARRRGARVTSELELFLERCPSRLALVTGTQGKSSTASFLATLLEPHAPAVHLGGNIGRSLLGELQRMTPGDVTVLEVSSYQLEALGPDPPRAALAVGVTNVGADHLERHGSIEAYAAAKARVLELLHASGTAVLPAGEDRLRGHMPLGAAVVEHADAPGRSGLRSADGRFLLDGEVLGAASELRVPGGFQRANALVALGMARLLGVDAAALASGVGRLGGLPHRMEDVGLCAGRRVIDNGVSTTPESTVAALESLRPEPGALALVCGGRPKRGVDYAALARCCRAAGARVTVFGEGAEALAAELTGAAVPVDRAVDLAAAVRRGLDSIPEGGTLLFSPACASFDGFANYRARALEFRRLLAEHGVAHA